ncbi:MAG: extracellular solute-binding protein [Clostridia bacterium]|nr:extracellular solute-binding protein [Clostridia bacterium]
MKRVLALILCFLMLVCLFASCTGKKKSGEAVKELSDSSHVPEGTTFKDETFTILCREDNVYGDYLYEIVADEAETELVNQAVYQRNRTVMDTFGLSDVEARAIPGDWNSKDDFVNTMRNSIDAGIGDFDLIMSQQAYLAQGELAQYFYDFNQVPVIKDTLACEDESHDHSYYYEDAIDELTINGQLKYMVGDYSLTYWDHVYVLYFNKVMAENYQLENIYDLVRNGEWTVDKMLEMAKGKWVDLNSDEWPGQEDSFGYVSELMNPVDAWNSHFDVQPTHRDENGDIVIDYDVGKMTNVLTKMLDFKATDDCAIVNTSSDDIASGNPCDKYFLEGRGLFYHATLQKAQVFRKMETDFGIVPYPKWDTNQTKYYTCSQDGYSAACVPADAPNLELTGAVFDTLSSVSKETVIPAYYDEALTFKYTRDEDSAEMLDIIREGFSINFGKFYNETIRCARVFRDMVLNDNPNFASYYAANKPGYERKLSQLLEYYE